MKVVEFGELYFVVSPTVVPPHRILDCDQIRGDDSAAIGGVIAAARRGQPIQAWAVHSDSGVLIQLPCLFLAEELAWAMAWWLSVHQADA